MFERYLTDALAKHFGHVIEDLDTEKARLSAWDGRLILEDVFLRTDALDSFVDHCPVEIVFGKVGKLDAQVPWSLVGYQLWKNKTTRQQQGVGQEVSKGKNFATLILSDVNILITPRRQFNQNEVDSIHDAQSDNEEPEDQKDEQSRKQKWRESKEKAAQELMDGQLISRVAKSTNTSSLLQWIQDWFIGWLSKLSVTAKNIHIRYEDAGNCMGFVWKTSDKKEGIRRYRKPFSIGVTLQEFSLKTLHEERESRQQIDNELSPKENSDISITGADDNRSPSPIIYSPSNEFMQDDAAEKTPTPTEKKMVATEKIAIYWNSNGCSLLSENALFDKKHDPKNCMHLERSYVNHAFSILNSIETTESTQDDELYRIPHTYLLHPVSPHVVITVALEGKRPSPTASADDIVPTTGLNSRAPSPACEPVAFSSPSPSSVNILLPPTLLSISRQTLEDTVYLRKSFDAFQHAKRSILSDSTLRKLASLRPEVSAVDNPRGWWKYAVESTLAFIKTGHQQAAGTCDQHVDEDAQKRLPKRHSGWLGLAEALGRRRRYVNLYRELLEDVLSANVDNEPHKFGPILPIEQRQLISHSRILEYEDELTSSEICAFRIAAFCAVTDGAFHDGSQIFQANQKQDGAIFSWKRIEKVLIKNAKRSTSERLPPSSLHHRLQMFLEMGQALEREKINTEIGEQQEIYSEYSQNTSTMESDNNLAFPVWEVYLFSREVSLRVIERCASHFDSPDSSSCSSIAQLSCVCLVESNVFNSGSWEVNCTVAELAMDDLMSATMKEPAPSGETIRFRRLIGANKKNNLNQDEYIHVGGQRFQQSARVHVRRNVVVYEASEVEVIDVLSTMGTATHTEIRLFPLEFVYSTLPIEALSRVLATVKTPELRDDYYKMAARVHKWREQQQQRLFRALAHKRKKIFVNVDVAAPVILIPEALNCSEGPVLVLDLGQLRFDNLSDDVEAGVSARLLSSLEDTWQLHIKNVQISYFESFTSLDKCAISGGVPWVGTNHQVVENFSLNCSIFTVFSEKKGVNIKVDASLPKLSFNIRSSSVRLIDHLRHQWSSRRDEVRAAAEVVRKRVSSSRKSIAKESAEIIRSSTNPKTFVHRVEPKAGHKSRRVERLIECCFSAPLITLRLENDVDARPSSWKVGTNAPEFLSTPIVSLVLRGIVVQMDQQVASSLRSALNVDARLHSLHAVDHYQTAGAAYAMMLSSFDPKFQVEAICSEGILPWNDLVANPVQDPQEADLVHVQFASSEKVDLQEFTRTSCDELFIRCHEFYVEWNPETLAAMQKSLRNPLNNLKAGSSSTGIDTEDKDEDNSDDVFFDAEEELFYDPESDKNSSHFPGFNPLSQLSLQSTIALLASPKSSSKLGSNLREANNSSETVAESLPQNNFTVQTKSFDMEFNLTKLRVNFNKDSRHRRLLVAEMDRTSLHYTRTPLAGSKTRASLGNLVFSDPASVGCHTLYSEILGLQNDFQGNASSLLEMEIRSYPRRRQERDLIEADGINHDSEGVFFCYNDGTVAGSDTLIQAQFSPMRFVYLQQLWSEVVDYFFEGVMGSAVWGNTPPKSNIESASHDEHIVNPYQVPLTKLDITIDTPVVLFPVTYCSPQFLKLEATSITIENHFDCRKDSLAGWHNNCQLSFQGIRMRCWDNKELTHSDKSVGAVIELRWPIGPSAYLEIPKWNVRCNLDSLEISLRREDYALLQNIISHNIGELSRNLDEWEALQKLSHCELEQYKERIFVHFGYDKKDVAPTTYRIGLKMPMVTVVLESRDGSSIVVSRCHKLVWKMKKFKDRISQQTITCDIDLTYPGGDNGAEPLLTFNSSPGSVAPPNLCYSSTSKPSGDNVKTWEAVDSQIHIFYPGWKALGGFFASMPEAEIFSPHQVALSVQIGDRWYSIAKSPVDAEGAARPESRRLSWIGEAINVKTLKNNSIIEREPSYQTRLLLVSPRIILPSSNETSHSHVVLRLGHLDLLSSRNVHPGKWTKSFFVHDMELFTSPHGDNNRTSSSDDNLLMHPWCFSGLHERCSGELCECDMHSFKVSADILRARAAFSDMMIVIDVCLRFLADYRKSNPIDELPARSTSASQSLQSTGLLAKNDNLAEHTSTVGVSSPSQEKLVIDLNGLEFLVLDDSGRHFAGSQELIILAVQRIQFSHQWSRSSLEHNKNAFSQIKVRLQRLDLIDCLQPATSPFQLLATSQPEAALVGEKYYARKSSSSRMKWDSFSTRKSTEWGLCASPTLVERAEGACSELDTSNGNIFELDQPTLISFQCQEEVANSKVYSLKFKSFGLNYNTATVVACLRFMGRLKKQALKQLQILNKEVDKLMQESHGNESLHENSQKPQFIEIKAEVQLENITVCLNKEHQQRRILRVKFSRSETKLHMQEKGLSVEGSLQDLSAWDCNVSSQTEESTMDEDPNVCVLRVKRDDNEDAAFLKFRFRSFNKERRKHLAMELPQWVHSQLSDHERTEGKVDDFLEIAVGMIELTYLRERSEEMLDYLSNGLPGKGMGATSKAAKGFIEKRIQTRSFLQVRILSPGVLIPRNRYSSSGLRLRLGDVELNSWFEGASLAGRIDEIDVQSSATVPRSNTAMPTGRDDYDWWRMLSLRVANVSAGIFERRAHCGMIVHDFTTPLSLSLALQKSAWHGTVMSLRCRVSMVNMALKYSFYCQIMAVLGENIQSPIDRASWDNIEKAYDLELKQAENENGHDLRPKPIEYATGARHVRFGRKTKDKLAGQKEIPKATSESKADESMETRSIVDMKFTLDGLAITLQRDDTLKEHSNQDESQFYYDMVLLQAELLEVSISNRVSDDLSLQLSLYRIGMFDLGDRGRLLRESVEISAHRGDRRRCNSTMRMPCAFHVLVEGYSCAGTNSNKDDEPQLVVTIDKVPSSSVVSIGSQENLAMQQNDGKGKVTVAKVVLNYLSVNAMIRPFREIAAFVSLAWPSPHLTAKKVSDASNGVANKAGASDLTGLDELKSASQEKTSSSSCLHVKIVAHCPRIFFVSDESDLHSRALVLRGLAVINAGRTLSTLVERGAVLGPHREDIHENLVVDAQLHSLESYINPDVSQALGLNPRHCGLLFAAAKSPLSALIPEPEERFGKIDVAEDTLGVALLQPVTAGIEFGKSKRSRFPSKRFLCVNVEPISTMLSFDDLQLIESVLKRWTSESIENGSKINSRSVSLDQIGSHATVNLGETLKMTPCRNSFDVVFRSKQLGLVLRQDSDKIFVEEIRNNEFRDIQVGDVLASIQGIETPLSLAETVQRLALEARPTTVTFTRPSRNIAHSDLKNHTLHTGHDDYKIGTIRDGLEDQSMLTLTFQRGIPNGLSFEKSPIGDIPVVTKVDDKILDSVVCNKPSGEAECLRFPRSGALLVRVNEEECTDLNFPHTMQSIADCLSAEAADSGQGPVSLYSLTFVEIESSNWGYNESIDLSVQGAVLTFIDDLNGRDMPLLRATLNAAATHLEKGVGIRTAILEPRKQFDSLKQSATPGKSLEGDSSIALAAIAKIMVEYFHPRKAVYEPLVEPAQICAVYESHHANHIGPGEVAVELSDKLLPTASILHSPSRESDPQPLCLNFSDASAEVLAKALHQWKFWRNNVKESPDLIALYDDKSLQQGSTSTIVNPQNAASSLFPGGSASLSVRQAEDNQTVVEGKLAESRQAQLFGASSAANAAFRFAQKRGAEPSGRAEKSKPFVFRNRTGVSIAFAEQKAGGKPNGNAKGVHLQNAFVAEYEGLDMCDPFEVTELADGEDAKFQMEVHSNAAVTTEQRKKIRSYEGNFPCLVVSVQTIAGVQLSALHDLRVQKAGVWIRQLRVQKAGLANDSTKIEHTVPVVWTVEVEDNRRVLTLSSSVRFVSLCCQIEIGVARDISLSHQSASSIEKNSSEDQAAEAMHSLTLGSRFEDTEFKKEDSKIKAVGTSLSSEKPYYLPLWLAMKFEHVQVFIRPYAGDLSQQRSWGDQSLLEFGPLSVKDSINDRWGLKGPFKQAKGVVKCASNNAATDTAAAFLSYYARSSSPNESADQLQDMLGANAASSHKPQFVDDLLSVYVDAGLTLRNLLPIEIDYEAASGVKADLDGQVDAAASLSSGECADVYACNLVAEDVKARFRLKVGASWSKWALVSSPMQEAVNDDDSGQVKSDGDDDEPSVSPSSVAPAAVQINVQMEDDFGVPLTIGIRVFPKLFKHAGLSQTDFRFGVEVIVFAELWISNLTSLPLAFGCPGHQLFDSCDYDRRTSQHNVEAASKFSAEAALMEIASVLELGDSGTGFDTRSADMAALASETYLLPYQRCPSMMREIFEYIETEESTVKRRWWASECYWNLRNCSILHVKDIQKTWHWVDEYWKVDCSGHSLIDYDGWETCKDLLGGGDGPFSGNRQCNPAHTFRRRRWFRELATNIHDDQSNQKLFTGLLPGLDGFHHPIQDSFGKLHERAHRRKQDGYPKELEPNNTELFEIAMKCGDGRWSVPAKVSSRGSNHGVIEVFASRWPTLTKTMVSRGGKGKVEAVKGDFRKTSRAMIPYMFGFAPLDPALYELVYQVSDVEGEWGEFSRHLLVSSRFSIRNDSETTPIEIKQAGASDDSATTLSPGQISPFYWSDFRLPRLICARPIGPNCNYKWSGGFDACRLGMTALSVRSGAESRGNSSFEESEAVRSIRTLVELRPGTGSFGINVSFTVERHDGEGALFRMENNSCFDIWLSQDGVLANPGVSVSAEAELDGSMIRPGEKVSFGLDIPYRQGKYSGREPASPTELLYVRVGLAPLSSRAGIETTKVIGLSFIGESVRLKPSKLISILSDSQRHALERLRVLAVVAADGPSRVLKFSLMCFPQSDAANMASSFLDSVSSSSTSNGPSESSSRINRIINAASLAEQILLSGELPSESEVKRLALFGGRKFGQEEARLIGATSGGTPDKHFFVRMSFSGLLFSLVDSMPSEICTVAIKNIDGMAKWSLLRASDASILMSIGGLQVDNHVPSAPFPVALHPERKQEAKDGDKKQPSPSKDTPLLFVGIEVAPRHSSGIVCIKSVTVALQNTAAALDLAFLIRLQRYFLGIQAHFKLQPQKTNFQKTTFIAPDIIKKIQDIEAASATGVGRQQVYLGALVVLPFTVRLSVAPARALTPSQAAFEGPEAAAIHKAVRKGDLSLGKSTTYPLGVIIGRKNTTAKAVVQGVFKSIVVDALLRLDGASVALSGAFFRNQIFSAPQLATYLGAHYMMSLRQNFPALLGSLAAIGNPLGFFRGLGDGMTDFVTEPVKGIRKAVLKHDPQYVVDGVARGTNSLARHTVGGFADSAALLTSTFSKNMAVLTLDRRYAQQRDRDILLRDHGKFFLLDGVESGFVKLAHGFIEGVTGVVKAPMRGAERSGFEGFAKGIGKGLLGLLVKPMIGISDAATDVMLGVKSSMEHESKHIVNLPPQIRMRRAIYGRDKILRQYDLADAAACALMLRTRIGGQRFLGHLDMDDRVALSSDKRLLLLDSNSKELLLVKFKHVSHVEVRNVKGKWSVLIMLRTPRQDGNEIEVVTCKDERQAQELATQISEGVNLVTDS